MTTTPRLADPLTLPCGATLKNRLAKSAMSEALGTADNHVTPALATLYGRWADGGTGLVISGNVMVDRRALGEPNNVALEDTTDLPLLRTWAESGTRNGTHVWLQLNHPGRQSPKGLNAETVAPSAVPFAASMAAFFGTPRALTGTEIQDLVDRFGRSAEIAREAGFTGVQIHGAHGYLVSQFLSPHTNQRTDEWGGDPARRQRFVLEVYRAMRARTGPTFPIGIKLNSADFQRGGFTEEESLDVIRALSEAGIDLIEISGGTYEAPVMTGVSKKASTQAREAYFLSFAEKARATTRTPLMLTGGFRTAAGMDEALASGAVDVVGLARLLAIEPDAPKRLLAGQDPVHRVSPIRTGLRAVDDRAMIELLWYARQMRRMAGGGEPKPSESAWRTLMAGGTEMGLNTWRSRRVRA